MISQTLLDKLLELRLTAFREGLRQQSSNLHYADLSFEERLLLLVELECTHRSGSRIKRRLKLAEFPMPAAIEDLDFSPERGLDRRLILDLAQCTWIDKALNILILGATGTGKSFLACSLGGRCLPFRLFRSLCAYFPLLAFPGPSQTGWLIPYFPTLSQQNRSIDPGRLDA